MTTYSTVTAIVALAAVSIIVSLATAIIAGQLVRAAHHAYMVTLLEWRLRGRK